jgi:hypothetical protein
VVFVFLSLAYFAQHHDFLFHPFSWKLYNFILLYGWIVLHCVYISHFLYPFIGCWAPRLIL